MPVPVPPVSTARSVLHKCSKSGDATHPQSSILHLLKCTLPSSPTVPPPSFGTREQWISSLPLWRRAKTRHVWEDDFGSTPLDTCQSFPTGLAGAVDASAIKGAHVQTCIPPLTTLISGCGLEMPSHNPSPYDQTDNGTPSSELVTCLSPVPMELTGGDMSGVPLWPCTRDSSFEDGGGLFAPILEDDSPDMMNGDSGSSPIEPVTPFGDYVDRAVAASDPAILHVPLVPTGSQELQISISGDFDSQLCHPHLYTHVEAKDGSVGIVNEPPLNANLVHKQLAEPMAEWLVCYVWKVCTNVLVPPQTIASYTAPNAPQIRLSVPPYLTARVHSLLMSTLLQPSAMLLALWYIVRLPIYFGAPGLGPEHVKERRFRVELLGDGYDVVDGESLEGAAAFRLIVLGCMLANKWLDDHTFSNKTWHTISNVPVQLLNKLEYFALDIFSHDLSIPSSVWSSWLGHLLSYHHSLTTTTFPQPIARPIFNPGGFIRKTIQDIMEAPLGRSINEPVFLGVDQRIREKLGPSELETFDIDLDEDGPLREEYLPRRRVSHEGSSGAQSSELRNDTQNRAHLPVAYFQGNISLPPPAKWSPAGDEPICRPSGRAYHPVQPSFASHYVGAVTAVYHPWPTVSLPYAPLGHHTEGDFTSALPVPQYTYWAPINCSSAVQHCRPVRTPDYYTGYNHVRGYSVTGLDYSCSDIHAGCHLQPTASWTPLHQFGYVTSRQSLAPHPLPFDYRSSWPRA